MTSAANNTTFRPLTPEEARVSCACGIGILMEGATGRDARAALRMLARAHDAGNAEATHAIGLCLVYGVGIKRDERQGLDLIEQAARAGHAPALTFLADRGEAQWRENGSRRGLRRSLALRKMLADAGDVEAQAHLGCLLVELGARLGEAYGLLEKASRAGSRKAMGALGKMLVEGTGPVYAPDRGQALIAQAA